MVQVVEHLHSGHLPLLLVAAAGMVKPQEPHLGLELSAGNVQVAP
jgi:hypothetical protein